MQHRMEVDTEGSSNPFAAILGGYYGLAQCGPNSACKNNECVSGNPAGHYTRQRYSEALATVSALTRRESPDQDVANFFEQWSLAFVGKFATCQSSYYSSEENDIAAQDRIYSFDVPALVR